MGMGTAIMTCLEKFMIFTGRARRAEFWWFFLFTLLAGFAAIPIEYVLETQMITTGVSVAFLLPTLAAAARRLHDTDRPALFLLMPLGALPLFALDTALGALGILFGIALLMLVLCLPGTRGPNRFGPDPRTTPDLAAFE